MNLLDICRSQVVEWGEGFLVLTPMGPIECLSRMGVQMSNVERCESHNLLRDLHLT
jgi:hypothetical protein